MRLIDTGRITGELAAIAAVAVFAAALLYMQFAIGPDLIVLTRVEHEHLRLTMEHAQRAVSAACGIEP